MAGTETAPGVDRRPLLAYLRVQEVTEREILGHLRSSAARVDAELARLTGATGIGALVRREQLHLVQANLHNEMNRLFASIGDTVEAGKAAAASAAARTSFDRALLGRVMPKADVDFLIRSAEATASQGLATLESRLTLSKRTLSEKVYGTKDLADGKIDEIINSALVRGASAAELAKDVAAFVNPNTAGGVKYAANRLARTELNNAFHASQIKQGIEQPWCTALTWNLSGSHPRPDECNEYADQVHYRGGEAGDYRPEDAPGKPHPNCLCFTTPKVDSPEAFVDNFMSGRYDTYVDDLIGESGLEVPLTSIFRVGSPGLQTSMRSAERQRESLLDARYIQKGKGKGNYNPDTGYTSESSRARTNYTESLNSDMNLLKRNPEALAAQEDADWVSFVGEQNDLLEGLLSKNSVSEEITVARHMTGNFGSLPEGGYLADPGFLSTTTDLEAFVNAPSQAFKAATESGKEAWTFIIRIPKGTNALPGAEHQKEIIFGPGLKQRILQVDKDKRIVYTEAVK